MKKYFFIYLIFIYAASIFTSCSDDKDETTELPTTNFELGEPYRWTLSKHDDTFYIIDSYEEMSQYIESIDGTKPVPNSPDFKKQTLLLASGPTAYGVSKVYTRLLKNDNKNIKGDPLEGADYVFVVFVETNAATVAEGYIVAVTAPLLPTNTKIVKVTSIKY